MNNKIDAWVERARAQWHWRGQARPPFAAEPGPGQVSVWDFPRPPDLRPAEARVRVMLDPKTALADTGDAWMVCETGHPPTYYLPRRDVDMRHLEPVRATTFCEWKGSAHYYDVGPHARRAWTYPTPFDAFASITNHIAFYCTPFLCFVGDEQARPQPGAFYAGWVTDRYAGPFKGEVDG